MCVGTHIRVYHLSLLRSLFERWNDFFYHHHLHLFFSTFLFCFVFVFVFFRLTLNTCLDRWRCGASRVNDKFNTRTYVLGRQSYIHKERKNERGRTREKEREIYILWRFGNEIYKKVRSVSSVIPLNVNLSFGTAKGIGDE